MIHAEENKICKNCQNQGEVTNLATWPDIGEPVQKAIHNLLKDTDLFKFHVGERAVSHQFASHLRNALGEQLLSVDCEYNRAQDRPKGFPFNELSQQLEKFGQEKPACANQETDITRNLNTAINDAKSTAERQRPRRVIPDVIVHRRGCNCHNLLVVEMKVNTTSMPCVLLDWAKLLTFTDTCSNHPTYKFGLFLEVAGMNRSNTKVWLFSRHHRGVLLNDQLEFP